MDGEKHAAAADAPFVALGFVFRDTRADERAGNASHGPAHADSGESGYDGAGGDERTDAGNGERADSGQPSERATDHGAGSGSCRGSFGGFRVLLVSEVLIARVFGSRMEISVLRKPA